MRFYHTDGFDRDILISERQHNGEFDYWYVIEVIDCVEATGELWEGNKYHCGLYAIAPSELGDQIYDSADEFGILREAFDRMSHLEQLNLLAQSGRGKANCWQELGNNKHKLIAQAKRETDLSASFTFGFQMDKPQNAIGTTGWEWLKGDFDAGMFREPFSPEKRLMLKMHGYELT